MNPITALNTLNADLRRNGVSTSMSTLRDAITTVAFTIDQVRWQVAAANNGSAAFISTTPLVTVNGRLVPDHDQETLQQTTVSGLVDTVMSMVRDQESQEHANQRAANIVGAQLGSSLFGFRR